MRFVVTSTLLLLFVACASPETLETTQAPLENEEISFLVPWGDGAGEVGRFGHTGAGARSLVCLEDGDVALLDAAHLRVLRYGPDGVLLRTSEVVPAMADDLASLGASWALLERPARRVVVADADGTIREAIPLPVGLAPVTSLEVVDGDLAVTTAYQDTLSLRTPTLAAIREGVPCWKEQRCQLLAAESGAPGEVRSWRLLAAASPRLKGDGVRFEDAGVLPFEASAVRIMGMDHDQLLVLADTVLPDGDVRRELLWVDEDLGLGHRIEISVRGGAAPFRQAAICPGGGVAWMEETPEGIRVTRRDRTGGAL